MSDTVTSIRLANEQSTDSVRIESGTVDLIKITDAAQQDDLVRISQMTETLTAVRIVSQDSFDVIKVQNVVETAAIRIVGSMTLPGDKGEPGAAGTVDLIIVAAIPIGGHRVIATDDMGLAVYADRLSKYKTVLGISTGAANQGLELTVRSFNQLTEPSWNWDIDKGLFLGQNGLIIQDAPETGVLLSIGFVINPTTIFINIGVPLILM